MSDKKQRNITLQEAQQNLSYKEYSSLLASVELEGIRLKSIHAELIKNEINNENHVIPKLKHSNNVCRSDNIYIFESKFSLDIGKLTDGKNKMLKADKFLELKATYSTFLKSENDLPSEFIVIYNNTTLDLVLWPFLREMVVDMSHRFMIPPITLPLLKVHTDK